MVIERDKLYSDLKYPSLYKYIVKELKYSEAEATVRVNAVRLMLKSKLAEEKVVSGEISLTNAAEANKVLQNNKDNDKVTAVVEAAEDKSTREFKDFVQQEFQRERREVLVLKEYMLKKFDRLRKKYGADLSTLELVQIMLERELKDPGDVARLRGRPRENAVPTRGRTISMAVKRAVYTGQCANCGTRHGLEYDHIQKYSHGGSNGADNIQMLCRSCNSRKEIMARQTGLFV